MNITGLDIKKKRDELNLSQEKLAELLGVSRNTIYNWEKGGGIPESKKNIILNTLFLNSRDQDSIEQYYIRMNKVLDYLRISHFDLAKDIELIPELIYERNLSYETSKRIVKLHPEINYDWLLTGNGEMIEGDNNFKSNHISNEIRKNIFENKNIDNDVRLYILHLEVENKLLLDVIKEKNKLIERYFKNNKAK